MRSALWVIVLSSVSGLVACGDTASEQVMWANEGQLCLEPAPSPTTTPSSTATPTTTPTTPTSTDTSDTGAGSSVSFEAGDIVSIAVTFGGCDCGDDTTASCSATREGDVWTVLSEASSYNDCEPCVPIVATCDVGVLGPGTHSFQHGGDLMVVEVPGELDPSCVGEPTTGTVP